MSRTRRVIPLLAALLSAGLPLHTAEALELPLMCVAEPEPLRTDVALTCGPPTVRVASPLLRPPEEPDAEVLMRVRVHLERSRYRAALATLYGLEARFPRIADHIALLRGRAALGAEMPELALEAYESAMHSVDSTTRVLAQVGRVRSLIESDDDRAPRALELLLRRYPELPERHLLTYLRGQSLERQGFTDAAIAIYRQLDLDHPGRTEAQWARMRLSALSEEGVQVPPYTLVERVDRAERLVRWGPLEAARDIVAELLDDPPSNVEQRRRIYRMAARLARVEGRFDDRERWLTLARQGRRRRPTSEPDPPTEEEIRRRAIWDVSRARGGRPMRTLAPARLLRIAEIAARADLDETLDLVLRIAIARELPPAIRFDIAMVASGSSTDARVAELLATMVNMRGTIGSGARYHLARAFERLGRLDAAERAYRRTLRFDDTHTRYYAMWAGLRLAALGEERDRRRAEEAVSETARRVRTAGLEGAPLPIDEPEAASSSAPLEPPGAEGPSFARGLDASGPTDPEVPRRSEGMVGNERPARLSPEAPDLGVLADRLRGVAALHREAYPQLGRAVDFLRLGALDAAQRELYEIYLRWRTAIGRPLRRAGLEAVARGQERPREWPAPDERRKLLALGEMERKTVAEIAAAIGDFGTAIGLSPEHEADDRPRAHARAVEAAAAAYGLDPNLLFAVMRVESIYQRRIISYAGAIGLTQIMPRTGQLIAYKLGRRDFTTADLLDAETNLHFSAWYLASLIERFDGRLPLAIASYNGGPHNVRQWIDEHGDQLPLDALLERIPFSQTHRYVRRVLTHYAAYRAQQELPPVALSVELPPRATDSVGF